MPEDEARELVATIRTEIEQAADLMLSAAEKGLRVIAGARTGKAGALDSLERTFCVVLEACTFQDLVGQRLSKLESLLGGTPFDAVAGDPLLNGPAAPGKGLDQAAADALMSVTVP